MQIFEDEGIEVETRNSNDETFDTVVFPAHEEGFRETFLDENKWYYVRIRKDRIPNLKYIAIYVGAPVSKITHYAKIAKMVLSTMKMRENISFISRGRQLSWKTRCH